MAVRDVLLVLTILIGLVLTIRRPYAGVLLWTWFAIMCPNQLGWSFATTLQLNLVIAIVTIGSLLFSRNERRLSVFDATFWTMAIFLAWMTFNTFFSVAPDISWPLWNRTWKILALAFLVGATATNKVRVHALIWMIVISLFYYSVKGGLFTLETGGAFHVIGPGNSQIGDNNTLALALLMSLPLANYLRIHSTNKWARYGLGAGMILTFISILGSYSRGALIGLAALAVVWWLRSRRKFLSLLTAAVIVTPVLEFMPQSFYDRAETIQTASKDESFEGRVLAWRVAYKFASQHFPFGAGYEGLEQDQIFNEYSPPNGVSHAAHSIYFEVLGDQGFMGLFIYLYIIYLAFRNTFRIAKITRDLPEFEWLRDLSHMIQLSLIVFCTAGAALSMAYYDLFAILVMLLPALRAQCSEDVASQREDRLARRLELEAA